MNPQNPTSSSVMETLSLTPPSSLADAAENGSETFVWTALDSTLIWIKVEDESFCLPFRILTDGVDGLRGILLSAVQTGSPNSEADPCIAPDQVRVSDWKAWVRYRCSFGAAIENSYALIWNFMQPGYLLTLCSPPLAIPDLKDHVSGKVSLTSHPSLLMTKGARQQ
ncbi:hypothetical protein FS837_006564 [Tulasnella sp. UAMH 9824]|nr:hypothetical protein FS837_006564 [Tulasnella sp. UAMH 9824]